MHHVGLLIEIMLQSKPADRNRENIQTCLDDLEEYVDNWVEDLLSWYQPWAAKMVARHGEEIQPHVDRLFIVLEKVYTAAQKLRCAAKRVRRRVSRRWGRVLKGPREIWHAICFDTRAVCSVSREAARSVARLGLGTGSALPSFSMSRFFCTRQG